MNIIVTMLFGLESTVKEEILRLGHDQSKILVNDGRIDLEVSETEVATAAARLNMNLRTAERVLLKFGSGSAETFDELFDIASNISWERFIPDGWAFHVNGYSLKSKLFGIPSCQSIVKKAIVKRLAEVKGMKENSKIPEDPSKGLIKIVFSIIKNEVSFMADTSGDGLHKRGYRPLTHAAPLKETLAAGLVILSGWRPENGEILLDPMSGTGTIPIEAALIASKTAPGINRGFASEKWPGAYAAAFKAAREEAMDLRINIDIRDKSKNSKMIYASDIDPVSISSARKNSASAGTDHLIDFSLRDALTYDQSAIKQLTASDKVLIITNPPYGERMLDEKQAADLFSKMGKNWLLSGSVLRGLRLSIIAPRDSFENDFGAIADKRRKLYNGKIQCNMYHYFKSGRDIK